MFGFCCCAKKQVDNKVPGEEDPLLGGDLEAQRTSPSLSEEEIENRKNNLALFFGLLGSVGFSASIVWTAYHALQFYKHSEPGAPLSHWVSIAGLAAVSLFSCSLVTKYASFSQEEGDDVLPGPAESSARPSNP